MAELETLVLYCNATGYPTPRVSWVKRTGIEIKVLNGLRVTSTTSENVPPANSSALALVTSTLSLTNVTTEDSGVYVCEANSGDSAGLFGMSSVDVHVSGKKLVTLAITTMHSYNNIITIIYIYQPKMNAESVMKNILPARIEECA